MTVESISVPRMVNGWYCTLQLRLVSWLAQQSQTILCSYSFQGRDYSFLVVEAHEGFFAREPIELLSLLYHSLSWW